MSEPSVLCTFSWESSQLEVKETALSLNAILDGMVEIHESPSEKRDKDESADQQGQMIGLCTAILCRHHIQSMNLMHRLVSILLYQGGTNNLSRYSMQRLAITYMNQ